MRITPAEIPTMVFDWGSIKWHVSPGSIDGASSTLGEVIVNPSQGHAEHRHAGADEVIYVITGVARQTVADDEFDMVAGDAVWIPRGTMHSTYNAGWGPLRLIVTYTPGGEEAVLLELPDYRELAPGITANWQLLAK
jgi:oxalate decarboxylase/phosphoglucose isomerase-like protein (cupin superfamily)